MWSTGEGNGKPLQYSCLENPMNSMKRQKDRTLKDELPRSVIVLFVSVCLFFNSSKSLLIDSCIFSILFSRFLTFTIIILNSFLGNLPISSSFIWTYVFLVCSFICVVFLCLFIISILTYYVWGLLFPGFKESWILSLKKVEFFLPFGFCSPKVGPVVCVSFM